MTLLNHSWPYIQRHVSQYTIETHLNLGDCPQSPSYTISLGTQQLMMVKDNVVPIHTTEYYSAIKKKEIMLIAGKGMELEIIRFSKKNQAQKDNYMFSLM
jgi:hypothetical protein